MSNISLWQATHNVSRTVHIAILIILCLLLSAYTSMDFTNEQTDRWGKNIIYMNIHFDINSLKVKPTTALRFKMKKNKQTELTNC